jgi:hypothetical protein
MLDREAHEKFVRNAPWAAPAKLSPYRRQSLRKQAAARKPAAVVAKRKRLIFRHPDPTWPLPADYTWYALVVRQISRECRVAAWLEGMGFFITYPLATTWRVRLLPNPQLISAPRVRSKKKDKRPKFIEHREPVVQPLIPRLLILGSAGPVPWLHILNDEVHRVSVLGIDGRPHEMYLDGVKRLQAMSTGLNGSKPHTAYLLGTMAVASGLGDQIIELDKLPKGRWDLVRECFGVTPPQPVKARVRDRAAA